MLFWRTSPAGFQSWVPRLMWNLPVVSVQRMRTCGLVKIDQVPNGSLLQDSRAGSISAGGARFGYSAGHEGSGKEKSVDQPCRSARVLAAITSGDSHGAGGKWRVRPGSVALLCRWPHDRQIAPTSRMSVSFDISFSRAPVEPATTGPAHSSQE